MKPFCLTQLNVSRYHVKDLKSSLPVATHLLSNGTLLFRNIKKSHKGTYICRAATALTTIKAKVKINSPVVTVSCSVIGKYVSSVSGNYAIYPDGEGGLAPFTVFCDITDKGGVGVTVISHDNERRTHVNGYSSQGSYSRDIHYTGASLSQLAVSPEFLHTVNSSSNMTVWTQFCFYTIEIHTDGECHVILLK